MIRAIWRPSSGQGLVCLVIEKLETNGLAILSRSTRRPDCSRGKLTHNALVADLKSAARARSRSGKLDGAIVPPANGFGATCLSTRPVDTVEFAFPCRLLPLQPRFIQDPFRGQRTGTARSKGSPVENRTYEILNARKVQIFMRTNHLGPEWMH